ncbi:hypothetical protein [Porphyromonas uenonis]|uniref:hypothetical protein n=1 Tax=Porphyromonas uenonis TaxID=281920 RepID=UPI002673CC65|nr:hypothetical protein [Porphyromonas uenonis]
MKQDATVTKQSSTKSYSWLIYLAAWLVIVLIQSILIGQSSTMAKSFWQEPSHYLSTWLLDIFLIAIFYLNYYYVAGHMMRRRHFGGYIAFVVIVAVVALFMPILCKALFGWRTPTQDLPFVTVSWSGAIGAVTVITIGLAVRALLEWLKLNKLTAEQREELIKLRNEVTSHKMQAKSDIIKPTTEVTPTTAELPSQEPKPIAPAQPD